MQGVLKMEYPNPTVTFMIEHGGKFLLVYRESGEKNFPGVWAFPGGKVEVGENVVDTIRREVLEETGLEIGDEAAFLNSYSFNTSVGITFLLRAKSDDVRMVGEHKKHQWVEELGELEEMRCIPGIHNHLVRAKEVLSRGHFDSLEAMRLAEEKYLNRG
jgi:8-oxo-dGTP diphosphatase